MFHLQLSHTVLGLPQKYILKYKVLLLIFFIPKVALEFDILFPILMHSLKNHLTDPEFHF